MEHEEKYTLKKKKNCNVYVAKKVTAGIESYIQQVK